MEFEGNVEVLILSQQVLVDTHTYFVQRKVCHNHNSLLEKRIFTHAGNSIAGGARGGGAWSRA